MPSHQVMVTEGGKRRKEERKEERREGDVIRFVLSHSNFPIDRTTTAVSLLLIATIIVFTI